MPTLNNSLVDEKLDYMFKEFKCAAKVDLAFGLFLENIEGGSYRYFYAHDFNATMEKSKHVYSTVDINNMKEKLQKLDIVGIFARERSNIKCRFFKLINECFCFTSQRCTHRV